MNKSNRKENARRAGEDVDMMDVLNLSLSVKQVAAKAAQRRRSAMAKAKNTIMDLVRTMMVKNPAVDAQTVIKAVAKKFPKSKCNKAHVAWYRFYFRKNGDIPKVVKKAAKPVAKKMTKKAIKKTAAKKTSK